MSYQVLARKWRPRTFAEMVGQEHVLRALINALENNRLHHAFLFTGTRGVGKTTVARILAKSLNCESGVTAEPCGQCSACREIDEGRFVDLIEVDAASRTKVEDTRELLENVQYAPSRGRYKVYLVDEVHMLSGHSFNALLKTLEEPPPHVKFLLATTDPQKLPVTILSRCLQFSLKHLRPELIRDHLAYILEQEQIPTEAEALQEIAYAADGSMRDALSLLDQAIAYGGGAVKQAEVVAMLGTVDRERVINLARALAANDAVSLMAEAAALAELNSDFGDTLNRLNSLLQRVALIQAVPEASGNAGPEAAAARELAAVLSPEDVQLFYQIGVIGRRDLPLAPEPRSGFEMVLLRMLSFRPAGAVTSSAASEKKKSEPVVESAAADDQPPPPANEPATASNVEPLKPVPQATPVAVTPSIAGIDSDSAAWARLVESLDLGGIHRQLLMQAHCLNVGDDLLVLGIPGELEHLLTSERVQTLEQALANQGQRVKLRFRVESGAGATPAQVKEHRKAEALSAAEQAIAADEALQQLLHHFDGEVVTGSVRPKG